MGEKQHLGLGREADRWGGSDFCEKDIRPDELMAEKQQFVAADREYLLCRADEFIEVDCPACNASEYISKFQKLGFFYSECSRCGTIFTNPRPSESLLRDFYRNSQNYEAWNQTIFPATEAVRRERIFRPRAEKVSEFCQKFGVTTNTLIEIGAGFGTFCDEMRSLDLFKRIVAVEPTPELARRCHSKKLEVLESPIDEIPEEVKADVITCFEVIEHLFSPYEFVMQCSRLLNLGGLLVITCPNCQGFDIATLGTLSNSIDHEHLNYFHIESLPLLLKRCKFEVQEVQTPGKLDAELVRKHVLSGALGLKDQPLLREILVYRWEELGRAFQAFLSANHLSSHMWVVARKIGERE